MLRNKGGCIILRYIRVAMLNLIKAEEKYVRNK